MPINYVVGDATHPIGPGPKVICHCVNDIGQWGSGFVLAIRARWPRAEQAYREWYRLESSPLEVTLAGEPSNDLTASFDLGSVQFVQVEPELWVANVIGQHRNISVGERRPIRYRAIEDGLRVVAVFCQNKRATAHMPRIGAGLARGDWSRISTLIDGTLGLVGIATTVYDLEKPVAD